MVTVRKPRVTKSKQQVINGLNLMFEYVNSSLIKVSTAKRLAVPYNGVCCLEEVSIPEIQNGYYGKFIPSECFVKNGLVSGSDILSEDCKHFHLVVRNVSNTPVNIYPQYIGNIFIVKI